MKHPFCRLSVLTLPLLALGLSLPAAAAIYGTDTRREVFLDPPAERLAQSTALMVSPLFYSVNSQGTLDFDFSTLADRLNLCTNERFASQLVPPTTCTAFLVAPDLIVTAGHCASNQGGGGEAEWCKGFDWLFDYEIGPDGSAPTQGVAADRLYHCKQVVKADFNYTIDANKHLSYSADFALIQLDRPVVGHQPLKIAAAPVGVGDSLMLVGYPEGVPAKVTDGAQVSDSTPTDFFRAPLTAFGGESGGPVFNSANEVVGILVRGFPDEDYVDDTKAGCSRPNHCDAVTGRCQLDDPGYTNAAEIQRISAVLPYLHLGQ